MILPVLFVFLTCTTLGAFGEEAEDKNTTISEDAETCECVPFYLCKNTTKPESNTGIIDIHGGFEENSKVPKCGHYLDRCCGSGDRVPRPTPPPTSGVTCGTRNPNGVLDGFIAGEDESNYGEFPWMVAVLRFEHVNNDVNREVLKCGGSLIHPQVVLTAAHCVKGKKNLLIRAGEWDSQTDKEIYPSQEREVKEIIVHEKYLVVGTVCLPDVKEDMDGRRCFTTGWGTDAFGKEGKYRVVLKKVEQPTVPHGHCQEALRKTRLGPRFQLHESFLCAGGEKGKDPCKGDGGAPLVCPSSDNPNVYVQAGIVSWGIGCDGSVPTVFGNVPLFRQWIDEKMALHNFHTS